MPYSSDELDLPVRQACANSHFCIPNGFVSCVSGRSQVRGSIERVLFYQTTCYRDDKRVHQEILSFVLRLHNSIQVRYNHKRASQPDKMQLPVTKAHHILLHTGFPYPQHPPIQDHANHPHEVDHSLGGLCGQAHPCRSQPRNI